MKKLLIAASVMLSTVASAVCFGPSASIFGQNNNFTASSQLLSTPYTLGNKITVNVAGTITRLSFFKASTDTTTSRNLILWSSGGTNLEQCTTTSEPTGTAQWLGCAVDYKVSAGTTLLVTYDAPANSHGAYVVSNPTCSTGPSTQQNWLTCVDSRYATTISTFPTTIDGATDLADVVLTQGAH